MQKKNVGPTVLVKLDGSTLQIATTQEQHKRIWVLQKQGVQMYTISVWSHIAKGQIKQIDWIFETQLVTACVYLNIYQSIYCILNNGWCKPCPLIPPNRFNLWLKLTNQCKTGTSSTPSGQCLHNTYWPQNLSAIHGIGFDYSSFKESLSEAVSCSGHHKMSTGIPLVFPTFIMVKKKDKVTNTCIHRVKPEIRTLRFL